MAEDNSNRNNNFNIESVDFDRHETNLAEIYKDFFGYGAISGEDAEEFNESITIISKKLSRQLREENERILRELFTDNGRDNKIT